MSVRLCGPIGLGENEYISREILEQLAMIRNEQLNWRIDDIPPAKIYRIRGIRCCGCGAKLVDAAAFQVHCAEVKHDDDFALECEEISEVLSS